MNGTLLVARPWSNKVQLVMARVGGCTLFRRNGGEGPAGDGPCRGMHAFPPQRRRSWVHSKSLKKCRCAEHHPAGHHDKIMADKAQELLEKPYCVWLEANDALGEVTRDTSADNCLAVVTKEAEALRIFEAAKEALVKFEKKEELPGKAEAAAAEARKKFGEQMTPILEAQREAALKKYGDNLAEHVKFTI